MCEKPSFGGLHHESAGTTSRSPHLPAAGAGTGAYYERVKVTLTVEAGDGQLSHVEAESDTYEAATAAARTQIPEGSRAIAIRTAGTAI